MASATGAAAATTTAATTTGVTGLRYYAGLLALRARTSLATGMQYRWNFLVELLMSVFWAAVAILPVMVLRSTGASVPGWSYPQMVVVTGCFVLVKAVIDASVSPSFLQMVERVRDGTLDFILLKPADAQFLVSTEKFEVLRLADLVAGLALLVHAFGLIGRGPGPAELAVGVVLLGAAVLVVYSLWLLAACVTFWAVRLDNLGYLFMSVFDFARWPVTVFQGALRVLFTVIIPIGIMTTWPSQALLGLLQPGEGVAAVLGALVFATAARLLWSRAISHYTSASS